MKIKEKRLLEKKSQEEIARETGITLRAYQIIEKKNSCNVINALKIAKALNTTVEEIFTIE